MADITIADDALVVTLRGMRRIGTFRRELSVPLVQVRGATVDPGLATGWPGFRKQAHWPGRKVRGTNFYGRYLGGVFVQDGDRVFWDVAVPEHAIVVSLDDHPFKRLYLEVEDPDRAVRMIETAYRR